MIKSQIWNFDGAKKRANLKHHNPPHCTHPISIDDHEINTCREICTQHNLIAFNLTGSQVG